MVVTKRVNSDTGTEVTMTTGVGQEVKWLTIAQIMERHPGILGKNGWYERIKDGTLPSIRLGRKLFIPSDALERVLGAQGTAINGAKE